MCRNVFYFSRVDREGKAKTVKYMSLVFVLIFLVHGVVIIAVSIWMEVTNFSECRFLQKYHAPIHTQLVSGLMTLITCFACFFFTIWRPTGGFIRIFSFLLLVIVSLEIATVVMSSLFDRSVRQSRLQKDMSDSISDILGNAQKSEGKNCWEKLQTRRECCGADAYTDWIVKFNLTSSAINGSGNPSDDNLKSCECDSNSGQSCVLWNSTALFSEGCSNRVRRDLSHTYVVIRVLITVFAAVQCVMYLTIYCFFIRTYKQSVVDVYKVGDINKTRANVTSEMRTNDINEMRTTGINEMRTNGINVISSNETSEMRTNDINEMRTTGINVISANGRANENK